MRFIILLYIMLSTTQACSQIRSNLFITKVTNDFSRNSYFVVLNVKLSAGGVTSIIENDDLFYYFFKTKGYDEKKYKSIIAVIIQENEQLNISDSDYLTFGFTKLVESPKIWLEAKKGKDFVFSKYFKDHVIIDGLSKDEINNIIKLLFDWNIPARIDDESGYIVFDEN